MKTYAVILSSALAGLLSEATFHPLQTDPVSGTWTGTSLCQVKGSPCNDEIAAYHATKLPGGKAYRFQMNKVVNGKEEEMGVLDFAYDDASKTLTATNIGRGAKGSWRFKLEGKNIHGTLTLGDSTLYRIIEIHKAN